MSPGGVVTLHPFTVVILVVIHVDTIFVSFYPKRVWSSTRVDLCFVLINAISLFLCLELLWGRQASVKVRGGRGEGSPDSVVPLPQSLQNRCTAAKLPNFSSRRSVGVAWAPPPPSSGFWEDISHSLPKHVFFSMVKRPPQNAAAVTAPCSISE